MRTIPVYILILFILSNPTRGQQRSVVDSLIQELPLAKNDTIKTRLYKGIVEQYSTNNPVEAFRYAVAGMEHVKKMQWRKGVAVFNMLIGNLESDKGNYQQAIERFAEAYTFHISNKDYFNAASSLNNWGSAYQRQSVFDKATEKYFEALKLAESIPNNYLIAVCLGNIAKVYSGQNDFDKSLEYDFKALEIQQSEENSDDMADIYASIGNTYLQKKDTLHAREYYENALALHIKTENRIGEASVYTNMSNLFTDYESILDYRLKAQKIWDDVSPSHSISIVNLGNIVLTYIDMARHSQKYSSSIARQELLQKAEAYLNRAIEYSVEVKDKGNYAFLIGARSELEAGKGNFKKAYDDATLYHYLNDSIYSQESKNKIAAIEGEREVALRDKEIELNKVALSAQRKQNIALASGIILLFIIGVLLFRQNRIRKNTNAKLLHLNSQLDEANKVKARFFAILSHDLRSPLARLINFLHLQKDAPDLLTAEQTTIHQQKIITSAENLLENMETVLLWSKGQMTQFKPVQKKITISHLFKQLSETFKGYEKITLSFSSSEDIEVFTDENYLFTIMQNLTANAIKALHETPESNIVWKVWRENNDQVALSITDNGPGLSEAMTNNLFKEQPAGSAKTGFGFHIVRDLAKAIDCTIEVQSTIGNGTTFLLHITV